jgi:hypothetical protein
MIRIYEMEVRVYVAVVEAKKSLLSGSRFWHMSRAMISAGFAAGS